MANLQASGVLYHRFYVGWGNNDAIVRNILKQRPWWQQVASEDFDEVSFLWTQWKKQSHIDFLAGAESDQAFKTGKRSNAEETGLKIYNRMEQNKQLTNKKGVFLNMRDFYLQHGTDPFSVLPLTFLIYSGKASADADFQKFTTTYH